MSAELATTEIVAIAGIIGTVVAGLAGAWIGSYWSARNQARQLSHADETRFQEQRMAAYVQFFDTMAHLNHAYRDGGDQTRVNDLYDTYNDAFAKLLIVATKPVRQAARDANAAMAAIGDHPNLGDIPETLFDELTGASKVFVHCTRIELRIEPS